jgi:hypothetical protein
VFPPSEAGPKPTSGGGPSGAQADPEQRGEQHVVADEHDRAAVQEEGAGDALLAPEITRAMIQDYVRRPVPAPRPPRCSPS